MPLDPNIPLSARMFQMKSPMESYAGGMQLQNLAGQGQLQNMQIQQTGQAMEDRMNLRNLASQYEGDPEGYGEALSGIDPPAGQTYKMNQISIQSAETKAMHDQINFITSPMMQIKDQGVYDNYRQSVAQKYPELYQKIGFGLALEDKV